MFRTFHTSDKAGSNDYDKQDDDDEFISTHYHLDNDDDDEYDNDDDAEDNESEQRDTFDLDCDDDSADEFFASDSFINAVELLGGEIKREHPQPPSNASNRGAPKCDEIDDPPPEKPDVSQMEADDAAAAIKIWRVQRKRWTDRRERQRKNERRGDGDILFYSGDCTPTLRMMTDVQQRCLMPGDSFKSKDNVRMRFAEEANLRLKQITTIRSDNAQLLLVVGVDFYVKVNHPERRGWVVSSAICRDGDGAMPVNAATRKIKWLGKKNDCIDLVNSDGDNDDSKF